MLLRYSIIKIINVYFSKAKATVTAIWGILLRPAHHIVVMDHLPTWQQVSTEAHMEKWELLLCLWQSPSTVTLVSKQQHTTMTLLVPCQVRAGSCSTQLITSSLKMMVFIAHLWKMSAMVGTRIDAFIRSIPVMFQQSTGIVKDAIRSFIHVLSHGSSIWSMTISFKCLGRKNYYNVWGRLPMGAWSNVECYWCVEQCIKYMQVSASVGLIGKTC